MEQEKVRAKSRHVRLLPPATAAKYFTGGLLRPILYKIGIELWVRVNKGFMQKIGQI
jgi:hypothetical protein